MEEQVTTFLQHLAEKRGLSANTAAAYRTDLDQFITFLRERGLDDWAAVSHDDVLAFLLYLRERRYANSTVARRTAAVKSFYSYLTTEGHVPSDPTERIDSPKVDRYLPKSLSPNQVDELLELPLRNPTPERLRDKAMIELLYATGMRVSELVSLNERDIIMEDSKVRCVGKGGRERVLPLNDSTMTALEEYLDIARSQLSRGAAQKTEALFLNHRGKRLTRQGFWLILKGYADEMGIQELTPHTLRHSFASHMINNGADVKSVQALLGHASLSTTQIYTQIQQSNGAVPRDGVAHAEMNPMEEDETVLAEADEE
ncbi:MAG TPA: site-specific tyrosine recombinase XerD [Roseiflexaceae bacterium]|jgi:integrase/recombinase XerD|nr:site-specific tyrosine recombinase XerD [Roseiflexaceae bacterium]